MLGTTIIGLFSIVLTRIDTNTVIIAKCIAIPIPIWQMISLSSLSSYSKFSFIVKSYPRPSSIESDSSYYWLSMNLRVFLKKINRFCPFSLFAYLLLLFFLRNLFLHFKKSFIFRQNIFFAPAREKLFKHGSKRIKESVKYSWPLHTIDY